MSREEAIEILKDLWRTKYSTYLEADIRKALEMAIQALEQEPIGHWIERRSRATGHIESVCSECGAEEGYPYNDYCGNCGAKMVER